MVYRILPFYIQQPGLEAPKDEARVHVATNGIGRETCAPVLVLPPSLGHGGDHALDMRRVGQRGQRTFLGDAIDAVMEPDLVEGCDGGGRSDSIANPGSCHAVRLGEGAQV